MKKQMSFEEAMSSLEDAIQRLEGQAVSLDESLRLFGEAVRLVKLCNEKLNASEKKVRILLEAADGTVDDAPFDPSDET